MVLHGERPDAAAQEALLAQAEAKIAAGIAARKEATNAGQAAKLSISRDAYKMRERRRDPELARRENLQELAYRRAVRALIENHADELLALNQIERQKLNLPVKRPRRQRTDRPLNPVKVQPKETALLEKVKKPRRQRAPDVVLVPLPKSEQDKCPHNMGLTKLPYGTFCVECGHKIR